MTMDVWLITDTHFNHDKIQTYCKRPPDFTERIIRNWQAIVKPDDLVIHLGDVIIGNRRKLTDIMQELPGRKVLVMGNHDRSHSATWWMAHGFAFACQQMVFRNVYLTHEPATSLVSGTEINIHGHVHTTPFTNARLFNKLFVLEHDYRPVNFQKFCNHPDRYSTERGGG